jgi:hypothetical protein
MTTREEAAFGIDNPKANAYAAKQAAKIKTVPPPKGQSGTEVVARLRAAGYSPLDIELDKDGRYTIIYDHAGYRYLIEKFDTPASVQLQVAFWKSSSRIKAFGAILCMGFGIEGSRKPAPASEFNRFVRAARG